MIVPRETFNKKPGTTDTGKEYEDTFTAYLALAMTLDDDVVDFRLSSNNAKFGKFDDVVFSVTKQNPNETKNYSIQLKQASKDGKNLTISGLMAKSGKESLQIYCKDYEEVRNEGYQKILYTNLILDIAREDSKLDDTGLSVTIRKVDHTDGDGLLSTSKASACYSFEVRSDDEENNKYRMYKEFFKNFTLYTNQDNLSGIKKQISDTFKQKYNCGQEACKMFNEFVSNWSIREGKKFELNKETVKLKIAECLLTPYLLINESQYEENQSQLFKYVILQFDVTILNNNVGRTLDVTSKMIAEADHQDIIKTGREFELISGKVRSVNDLDIELKQKILWYMDKAPFVIDFDKNADLVLKAIGLSKTKKFVLCVGSCGQKPLPGLNVFESFYDLERHCTLSTEIVEQCKVSIQERGNVPLQYILSDNVKSTLTASSILEMMKGKLCAGENQDKNVKYYVERAITTTVLDIKCLEEDDLFVINDSSRLGLKIKAKVKPIQDFLSEKQKKKGVISSLILLTDEKWGGLESLRMQIPQKSLHQVRIIDSDKLEWINTYGSVNKLKQYRLPLQESTIEELQLLNSNRPINIVCSAPGMGKTFMMQYFNNNYSSKYWMTYIDLKLHCSRFEANSSGDILKYVESIGTDSGNVLDCEIKKSFQANKKVVLLWDGLDEVPPGHVEVIIGTIRKFKDLGYKQWITSRPHLKQRLEDSLDTFASSIVEFSGRQQENYIKRRLDLDEENFGGVREKIVRLVGRMHNEFLGIPLLLFILTELFRTKRDWNFFSGMSRSILYTHFVEEKFKTYYDKAATCNSCGKSNFDNNIMKEILDDHRQNRLARYEVMGVVSCFGAGILNKCDRSLSEKFEKGSDGVGIVTDVDGDDIPIFFHRTFAEYFAACWLTKHHGEFPDFETVIFKDEFKAVRYMFDSILAEECPAHLAVLNGNLDQLKDCEKSIAGKDKGGRNVLHLLSSWDSSTYPLLKVDKRDDKYLVDCTPEKDIFLLNRENSTYEEVYMYLLEYTTLNPFDRDEIFHWDSFQYADAALCLYSLEILLSKYETTLNELKNYSDSCTVAYYSIMFDYMKLFNALESIPRMELRPNDGLLYFATAANADILQMLISDVFYLNKINTLYPCCNMLLDNNLYIMHRPGLSSIDMIEKFGILISVNTDENGVEKSFGLSPLHLATLRGDMNKIRILLEHGADIDISNEYRISPLQPAVVNGHLEVIEYLIQNGAKSDTTDYLKIGLLSLAAYHGHVDVMKFFLSRKEFNVNSTTSNFKITPIHAAAAGGQHEAMEYLVQNGADVNARLQDIEQEINMFSKISRLPNDFAVDANIINVPKQAKARLSMTPLHVAARNGDLNAVKLLVKNGASTTITNFLGNLPIHLVSRNGARNVAEYLIETCELGSSINNQNAFGQTCLHVAISAGYSDLAEYLIKRGVDVNMTDEDGNTSLHLSVKADSVSLVEVLLDKNTYDFTKNEISLLHFAMECDSINVFNFLTSHNFDIRVTTKDLKNLLHLAAYHWSYKVARSLITQKIFDINKTDKTGRTALHHAVSGHITSDGIKIIRLLLENNADVNASNCKMSPLFIAVNTPVKTDDSTDDEADESTYDDELCLEALKILIENGADVGFKREFDGSNPLMACIKHGHSSAVDLLLEAGADINAQDNDGNTALHHACLDNNKNAVSKLLNNKHIDPCIRNNKNMTASDVASYYEDLEEISQMLKMQRR